MNLAVELTILALGLVEKAEAFIGMSALSSGVGGRVLTAAPSVSLTLAAGPQKICRTIGVILLILLVVKILWTNMRGRGGGASRMRPMQIGAWLVAIIVLMDVNAGIQAVNFILAGLYEAANFISDFLSENKPTGDGGGSSIDIN